MSDNDNNSAFDPSPFATNPNPNCLYLTANLKSIQRKVRFTLNKRQGVATILGDIGLGKSSTMRYVYNDYSSLDNVTAQIITTPSFPSDGALLRHLSFNFGVETKRSMTEQLEVFNEYLVDQYGANKNVVVFIDEAQKLTNRMLELIRTLLNFETNDAKLIQFVLAGQLELWERLKTDSHKALFSRIFTNSLLDQLSFEDTVGMIEYRCKYNDIPNPFPASILEIIYSKTGGVPRDILKICAFAYDMVEDEKLSEATPEIIEESAHMAAIARTKEIEAEKAAIQKSLSKPVATKKRAKKA